MLLLNPRFCLRLMVSSICLLSCGLPKGANDLGHGFWQQGWSQESTGFEARTFHTSFHYKKMELCRIVGRHSISPSGRYAFFQEGPSGKLFGFDALTGKTTELSSTFIGLSSDQRWDEAKGSILVEFHDGHASKTFTFQP